MLTTISHSSHDLRAEAPADVALKRLEGIGDVLSSLDTSGLRTSEQTARALWTLDAAQKCIQAVLADVGTEPATEQLIRKSESLIGLIKLVRSEVVGLPASGGGLSRARRPRSLLVLDP